MALAKTDQQHLRAAQGYVELGLYREANSELEEIDPLCRSAPEVLMTRVGIYHGLEKWHLMAVVAGKLAEWDPSEPGYSINLAYATRRANSIEAAHAILTRVADLHPEHGMLHFNLACYEAQMGNIVRAKDRLTRATELDAKFRLLALDDPDLEPLWSTMAGD